MREKSRSRNCVWLMVARIEDVDGVEGLGFGEFGKLTADKLRRGERGWRRVEPKAKQIRSLADFQGQKRANEGVGTPNRAELPHLQCLGRFLGVFQDLFEKGNCRIFSALGE